MKCMFIKVTPQVQSVVVNEGLYYSFSVPQEECDKVLIIGREVEGKGYPLLAACSKVTIDRRIGRVLPPFPQTTIGRGLDYAWYLTIEKKYKEVFLPGELDFGKDLDQEMSVPVVKDQVFVCMESDGLVELELAAAEGKVLELTPEAEAHCTKKTSRSTKAKTKKEKAVQAAKENQQKMREEASEKTKPVEISEEDLFQVGEEISVEVGLGIQRKKCQGKVVAVEDRYWKNPVNAEEEIRNDQIVSVEVGAGQIRKFSAKLLRKSEKK